MPLRPVNAIFHNPKLKCIVIYQKGKLWKLSRMKIDIESWRRKTEFKGEKTELYLNRQQLITDEKLAKILPTQNFPETLRNATLHKFESWWLINGFDWLSNNYSKNQQITTQNLSTTETPPSLDTNINESNKSNISEPISDETNTKNLNNIELSLDHENSTNDTELNDWKNW